MILKAYLDQPRQFAPDPGEILYARRGDEDKFTLAVVEHVKRDRVGHVRLRVMWLEEDPEASPGEKDVHGGEGKRLEPVAYKRPPKVAPGMRSGITLRHSLDETPLIKRVDKDELPRTVITHLPPPVRETGEGEAPAD